MDKKELDSLKERIRLNYSDDITAPLIRPLKDRLKQGGLKCNW